MPGQGSLGFWGLTLAPKPGGETGGRLGLLAPSLDLPSISRQAHPCLLHSHFELQGLGAGDRGSGYSLSEAPAQRKVL